MSAPEEWRPVVGFEGAYEVSNLGRVRSLDRVVEVRNRWGGVSRRHYAGRVLAPGPHRGGYLSVHFYNEEGQTSTTLHSVVADAFLGPRPEGQQVCHDDGNKKHCALANLRYDTPKGNHKDKVRHGTAGVGEAAPSVKLSESNVVAIRARRGERQEDLAAEYGCTFSNISAIQLRKSWRHV